MQRIGTTASILLSLRVINSSEAYYARPKQSALPIKPTQAYIYRDQNNISCINRIDELILVNLDVALFPLPKFS